MSTQQAFAEQQETVDALNLRIAAQFRRSRAEYRGDDGVPNLEVQWRSDRGYVLCDYNECVPIDEYDMSPGGIERAARAWIRATR